MSQHTHPHPHHTPVLITTAVLDDLLAHDPDGMTHRAPNDDDFLSFKAWAVSTYGRDAWRTYMTRRCPARDV